MLTLILFSALLSCKPAQKEKPGSIVNLAKKQQPLVDTVQQLSPAAPFSWGAIVQPDTTINRKLFLEDYTSAERFYAKIETAEFIERIRSSAVMVFSNAATNQYLLAYQYEGDTKNAFSCFEIGYMKNLEPAGRGKMNRVNEKSFQTESGLALGLSLEAVVKAKGKGFKKTGTGNSITLTYRIEDAASPFLQRYSMPGYFMEFVLKENKVVKILFGFDYP
jgi:hypothetical protein